MTAASNEVVARIPLEDVTPTIAAAFANDTCLIWSGEWQAYWREGGNGYAKSAGEAGWFTIEAAYDRTRHCDPSKQIMFERAHSDPRPVAGEVREAIARLQAVADAREQGVQRDVAHRRRSGDYDHQPDRKWATVAGIRLDDLQMLLALATHSPAPMAGVPADILAHVAKLGRVEWGQTHAHDAEGHGAHVAESVRKTAAHFDQAGEQHMHGLWLEGTETVLCHTGTSPNAPVTTQALVGMWNWLVELAAAHPSTQEGADRG